MIAKSREIFIVSFVLLAGLFILTPRYVDPSSGESLKTWVSARVLAQTGGFPVFTLGPLYAVYLQVFRLFDYPWSVRLEYIATHFLVHGAIFLMLLRFLAWPLALFLSCAWIPYLAVLEPSHLVLGMAFICMYFRGPQWTYNQGYFPVTLLAAVLCHSAFLPFWAGHLLGEIIRKKFLEWNIENKHKKNHVFLIAKGLLFLLVILTVVHPSKRLDNNHMLANPIYCPVPLKDPLTIGFFKIGTWKEVVRTVPESLWISQDWYFVTPRIFKGAQTIWQGVVLAPDIVGKNILENIGAISVFPRLFMTGHLRGGLAMISLMAFPFGLIGMKRFYGRNTEYLPECATLITGSLVIIFSLLLTWFAERYMMALFPVGLLCLGFTGMGINAFLSGKDSLRSAVIRNKTMFSIGVGLIGLILFYNPATLSFVFHHNMGHDLKALSLGLDFLLLVCGILMMADSLLPDKILDHDDSSREITAVIVFFSASIVLLTSTFPLGAATQGRAVIRNEGFFDGVMNHSYKKLLKGLGRDSKVFEGIWLQAFGPMDLDNIYNLSDLPPYEDRTGKVKTLLNSLDAIWVPSSLSTAQADISTQGYLRYQLHLEPFLKDAVQEHRWFKEDLPGYGAIYRRGMAER